MMSSFLIRYSAAVHSARPPASICLTPASTWRASVSLNLLLARVIDKRLVTGSLPVLTWP